MLYIGNFKNIKDESIEIKITTKKDSGEAQLLLADNPVTITTESEGLFAPIKGQGATIRILTNQPFVNMYASGVTDTRVVIKNITLSKVIFQGYLTPNIYSQQYIGLDELELEAVCGISALKNIKFKPEILSSNGIINWYDLIKSALLKVDYTKFYISNSFAYKENNNSEFLKKLYQFEGNFIDDDEEKTPWDYYEILEEFCRFFGLTLASYGDDIYFIDYNNLNKFKLYNLNDDSESDIIYDFKHTVILNKNLYKDSSTNISYDDTYNKITIKNNLYEMQDLVPPLFKDLKNQNEDPNKIWEQQTIIDDPNDKEDPVNYTYLNGFFKSEKWKNEQGIDEITPDNLDLHTEYSFFQKAASYKTEEEPSSLDWKDYLTAYNWGNQVFQSRSDFLITKPKGTKNVVCRGGYFILNLDYKLSNTPYANECFKTSDQKYDDDKFSYPLEDTKFPCRLYVGDYYYDGEEWVNKDEFWRKRLKNYYKSVSVCTMHDIPYWYKYKDDDDDWVFCDERTWNNHSSSDKEKGKVKDSNHVYYFDGPTSQLKDRIYIDEPFYNECILEDRFWLVHKNKVDDKIFDDVKSLTNTVSWRMKIIDSEDGIAIKLPDFTLNGPLIFEVYNPTVLGDFPQNRGDQTVEKAVAVHISRLELTYNAIDKQGNIYEDYVNDEDIIYTNVINEDYVNEWDDTEMAVNTQLNNRITSMSSVLYKENENANISFLDKVFDKNIKMLDIQEKNVLNKYYEHYKTPKVIFNSCLDNIFTPIHKVYEGNLNKNFVVDSQEINVRDNTTDIKLIEL